MANITFDQINTGGSDNSITSRIGFFSLKNDGDEAVVRIMHDNTSSFELVTTHPVTIDGKHRRVNCIRDPRDPMENCPMCKAGIKIQQRFYIHLIQYTKDEQGNIIATPKVWERAASYAVTIKNLIDEYGPLSDCIFKIRRNGEAGSMQTTYSILFGNPQVYRSDFYPKEEALFENYSVIGTAVLDKNFDEIAEFMSTGKFPVSNNENVQRNNESTTHASPVVNNNNTSIDNNFVRNNMINPNTLMDNDYNVTNTPRPVRYY